MTTLPSWAIYVVSFGTPLMAFLGVVAGHLLLRRGANELDVGRRREETMRMLRWASEQAASADVVLSRVGIAALTALTESEMLQVQDRGIVERVMDALIKPPVDEIDATADPVDVVRVDISDQA